ncbi:MAG: LD-carboxypeptidase [Alphaproteobacteria bacterium]|nr:LD-carboxypeptidase [Alphaproteobacteria bacterium]
MSASVYPKALKKGDTIGIFSPSSYVLEEEIQKSKAFIEKKGFNVFIHPQTYERHNQSAGTHLQKALALQGLWQRNDIHAIWAAGGGNRALHLIDMINFKKMKEKPKLLIGFSDVTALLNAVYAHTSITTLHGPVFKNLHKQDKTKELFELLEGKTATIPFKKKNILKPGKANGHLIGGNLSVFQYLPQTLTEKFWKDGILFLEDCNEELSRLDRMFLHLRRLSVLKEIKGLLIGQFTDVPETGTPFGFTLSDIIMEHTEGLDIPIIMDMPFGHGNELYPLPIGSKVSLDTSKASIKVKATVK